MNIIATLANTTRRELAQRVSGGIGITLHWNADDNSISVELYDSATEETIMFAVAPEQALDAFHHPYAHLTESPSSRTEECPDPSSRLNVLDDHGVR